MKVLMITGSYPPENCGVGDYTYQLVNGLTKKGIKVDVFHTNNSDLNTFLNLSRLYDVIHIQYPTIGYGFKFTPHYLSLLNNCVMTLHEFSQVNILRRLSTFLFTIRSQKLIFSNNYDKNKAVGYFPWMRNKVRTIPIGTNILASKQTIPYAQRKNRIVYFGIIRPDKGIEKFFNLAELVRGEDYSFLIMGGIDKRKLEYANHIEKLASRLDIDLILNKSMEYVSKELQNSKYGYLSFPDGASERRGSLLAMLINGISVFTTRSVLTPNYFNNAMTYVEDPSKILIELNKENKHHERISNRAMKLMQKFDWEYILDSHIELYKTTAINYAK